MCVYVNFIGKRHVLLSIMNLLLTYINITVTINMYYYESIKLLPPLSFCVSRIIHPNLFTQNKKM